MGGRNRYSNSTQLTNYLNSITSSLDTNDVNLAMIPGPLLTGPAGLTSLTGSVLISGSNNFLMSLGSSVPANQGRRQVLGSANISVANVPTVNTSSLTIPAINNNYIAGATTLTYSSGSSNNAHTIAGNIILATTTLNHISGSGTLGNSTSYTNNITVGPVISNITGQTNTVAQAIFNNLNAGTVVLNALSSSLSYNANITSVGGNGLVINNRYFTTGSNNRFLASANIVGGQGITVNTAGSPATNVERNLVGNIIGGQLNTISLEQTGTDLAGLRNSMVMGYQLNISGSHSVGDTTRQGAAFLGRWNGEDNGLNDSSRTVFAVGTGTASGNRRTGFYITSGSLVGVSGSLDVKGNTTITGSLIASGSGLQVHQLFGNTSISSLTNALVVTGSATINHTIAGQPALTVRNISEGQPGLNVTGSVDISGSLSIANAGDLTMYGHKMFNTGEFFSNTTQSGSAGVSGSLTFSSTANLVGTSLVSDTRLTVANAGTYNVQFSAQIETSGGADTVHIWFKKNGNNINDSATKVVLANNTAQVMTVNILDEAAANDYYELGYQTLNGNATILSETASGNIPAIPSVIATITQAR
jgi:hypothetical protein